MKQFFLLVLLVHVGYPGFAQFRGGVGDGLSSASALLTPLSAASMFAGGSNDGAGVIAANGIALAAVSQYAGGIDDGFGNVAGLNLALSSGSMFAGGINDGMNAIESSGLLLNANSMYAGGANDGFNQMTAPALPLSTESGYAGGAGDGTDALSAPSLALGALSMYAGGGNDGFHATTIVAVALESNSLFAGGGGDGFSSFAGTNLSVALPLSLLYFTAARVGEDALLEWEVATPRAIDGFELERSYDGSHFISIHFTPFDAGVLSYAYTDLSPAKNCNSHNCTVVYYRLRLSNAAKNYSYSPVQQLLLDAAATEINVFPNPAADKIVVQVLGNASFRLTLFNAMGQLVLANPHCAGPQTELDIRSIPTGIYYLRLSAEDQQFSYQISITH